MNYRLLNEVLIEWNESSKRDSDNVFLKSEDIKKSLDQYFIYRLDEKYYIKIFRGEDWPEFKKYKDKVWVNGKHIKLDDRGYTIDEFEPGEYKVYIEDIDKIIDISYMFYRCTQLVSAFIPNSVTIIGAWAFYCCNSLSSVTIPNSVTIIGFEAFSTCTDLMNVTIPNSVTYISDRAFEYCSSLMSMTIPNSIASIGGYVFYNCIGLTSVTIPNSVIEIGRKAFESCWNLKTVYVEDINKFNQIKFRSETADPRCYGAKVIELKK